MKENKIIRTCQLTGTEEEVTFQYALEKLNGYWVDIEEMLLQGKLLFTPYATYKLKN